MDGTGVLGRSRASRQRRTGATNERSRGAGPPIEGRARLRRRAPTAIEDRCAVAEVLDDLGQALDAGGIGHGDLFLTEPPHLHARSTVYFVGDARQPDAGCRWVVKRPDEDAGQEDLANPLDARQQFEALRRLSAHYARVGPALRVSRPVAFLPRLGALVLEYAPGTGVDALVRPRSLLAPARLLNAVALSARFLRHLHAIEPPGYAVVRPQALAQELLALADEQMRPAGLVLPAEVTEALRAAPEGDAVVRCVRLHGDFAPVNMIIGARASVTGIDVSLDSVGTPEEDLARFIMMLATERLFLAAGDAPAVRALRRRAESVLLASYYGEATTSALLELHVIGQLCRRWLRREVARTMTRPSLGGVRKRIVDRYFEALLRERARALRSAPPVGRQ